VADVQCSLFSRGRHLSSPSTKAWESAEKQKNSPRSINRHVDCIVTNYKLNDHKNQKYKNKTFSNLWLPELKKTNLINTNIYCVKTFTIKYYLPMSNWSAFGRWEKGIRLYTASMTFSFTYKRIVKCLVLSYPLRRTEAWKIHENATIAHVQALDRSPKRKIARRKGSISITAST